MARRCCDRRTLAIVACAAVVIASVALRCYALRSDPYPRLDWSAGLLTDEGFYVHNARNRVLFGRERTDEFNNMLLSPLLHHAQVAVFRLAGVGSVQARSISVVCSLASMVLIWLVLKPLFGVFVAWIAVTLLGLDHVHLLYSRMALMDPFAAFLAVMAFASFARATRLQGSLATSLLWYGFGGAVLALAMLNRSLCIYLVPAPFIALAAIHERPRSYGAVVFGMAVVVVMWAVLWWTPHRAEIAHMNRYYRLHQVQPASLAKLWDNVRTGAFGDHRGIGPYLFRHTPVPFALCLLYLAALPLGMHPQSEMMHPSATRTGRSALFARVYLVTWLLGGWLALSASNYSPSRYYVTTYPAMMALAALCVGELAERVRHLTGAHLMARLTRSSLGGFLLFHAVQTVVHRGGVIAPLATWLVLVASPILGAVVLWRWQGRPEQLVGAPAAAILLGLWLLSNGYWLGDWLRGIGYTQFAISRELQQMLPQGSVLIGDVAPGLCLDNRHMAANVIPGLCNGERPVETFRGRPRFVAILDGRWKERYWLERYPALVHPARRLLLRRVLRWDIGVYQVQDVPATVGNRRGVVRSAKVRSSRAGSVYA